MHYLIFFLLFFVSFTLALLSIPIFIKTARKWRLMDVPEERKVHRIPKPLLGGIAIFLSFYLTWFLGILLLPLIQKNFPSLAPYLPPVSREIGRILPLFFSGLLMLLVGLADDFKPLKPYQKLAGQVLAAFLLALSGTRITLFMPHPFWSYLITILWVVAVTNSFNLLDNMDGLAGGVALIASLIFLYISLLTSQIFTAAVLATFCGVLAGFLIYNFPPSKIFLGDAGSLWVGFTIASLTILTTFYREGLPTFLPVIMPLLILGVPFFDTISVIIIRWKRREPLFKADRNHFSHRLLSLGMTERQAILFIYLITFGVGINATLLTQVNLPGALVILLQSVVIFNIIAVLEFLGRRRNKDDYRT
ncbi:MAG: undecaprenyl/decaprenyl-phosphate alpha-N-acetylglucosaminyl 1-phosphate transferase [Caldiserica bacterium]|nr:undecaprenyl/decaprenyl-phosphate alpha-N-acetylglucosaminyl 1-phosphate transferase [Caldisericota bacterium]